MEVKTKEKKTVNQIYLIEQERRFSVYLKQIDSAKAYNVYSNDSMFCNSVKSDMVDEIH